MITRHIFWIILFSITLAGGMGMAQSEAAPQDCPDTALGETAEDCPWAGAARTLVAEAEAGRALHTKFEELLPALSAQIKSDSSHKDWKALWGKSINYDEYAKGIIVHPAIIQMLEESFGAPLGDHIVHAGMEHTYGYLFSLLKTPFGYKRARWVKVGTDEGFQLAGKPLSPTPEEGTFFSNVTYFLGSIAFRDRSSELKILKKGEARVAKSLTRFPYAKLKAWRIVETVAAPGANSQNEKTRKIQLRTDLIPFTKIPEGQANSHLLVYSILDGAEKTAQLITAFPVETSFIEKISQADLFGENKPVITRYNAYVNGLTGANLHGKRELLTAGETK